ncbi:hypothetical protein Lal_00046009 [Lupinus albus]|nr:hypothetical protein Lal_00046009 [Lupinus albus]
MYISDAFNHYVIDYQDCVIDYTVSDAQNKGFGVRVRSTKPKRAVLVCCSEGQHKVKSGANEEAEDNVNQTKRKCSTLRTGCQASLVVARGTVESNWVITSFVNDHNHIMVSPRSVSYMRCHKKLSVAAKSLVERFEEEGLPTGKSILFGCALLQDESDRSFIWLFQKWLEAMDGKKTVSIITDQDIAIRGAIAKVFPKSRHRLCLWHIMQKFLTRLAHIYHKKSMFKRDLKRCIRDSPNIEVFEKE